MILKYLRTSLLNMYKKCPRENVVPTFSKSITLNIEMAHRFWHGCCFMRKPNEKMHSQKQKGERIMKKVMVTVMALLVTAMIATAALAFGPGRGPGYGHCGRGDSEGFGGLNLTADQKTKMSELRDAHFNDVKPLRDQMFTKRDELRKLWLEPNPDQGKITAAQKEMRTVRDQMQDKMTASRLDALKILTPEQREKAKSFAAGYSAGRGYGQGRGYGKGRGFGPGGCGGGDCQGGGPGAGCWGRR
jgi:Spy/CpxP family protein refolding chaperone